MPALCAGLLAALMLATAPSLEAQIPAPPQARPVALVGGTIHTVSQGVIERGTLVFEEGRITAVGADVAVPAGAERVDVTGRHIYPGLIDAHSNMGLFEIGGIDQAIDLNELGPFNPNVRAHVAFHPASRHIGVARSSGVLVTVSAPTGGLISGLAAAMMMEGWNWEQMTVAPEVGLMVNWPSPFNQRLYTRGIRQLRDFFAAARAYQVAHAATPGGHATDARLAAMGPVLDRQVPVVVSANELRQIQDAMDWAADEGIRLVILGGRDAGFIADELAQRDVPVLLSSVLTSPNRAWEPYDAAYSLPARLHQAGVRFAIAGGSAAAYANRLPYEAGAAIAFGLPADEALRAVTLRPAQILGIDHRVGSLEPGRDATLMITTGNPLEYSTVVEQVYIAGRQVDMRDAHRQFFERYQEKLRQFSAEEEQVVSP